MNWLYDFIPVAAFQLTSYKKELEIQNKLKVLQYANIADLKTAKTYVGNDSSIINNLFGKDATLAFKTLFRNHYTIQTDSGFENQSIFTAKVESKDRVKFMDRLKDVPMMVQEYIPKLYELRITFVGKEFFAIKINPFVKGEEISDWRTHHYDLPYEIYTLPAEIEKKVLILIEKLDMNFGTIDFVVTPNGEYYFLEINPNGQWLWVEERTGIPIGESIAKILIKHDV